MRRNIFDDEIKNQNENQMLSGTVVRLNDAQAKQASLRLSRGDIFE
jgi:hypothetical protein